MGGKSPRARAGSRYGETCTLIEITVKIDCNRLRHLITEEIDRSLSRCPEHELVIRSIPVLVEHANTPFLRNRGLMFRRGLPENSGMLFSFPDNSRRSFWMKNTYIPLSVAFIGENGIINNIENMFPHDTQNVCSRAPSPYALEMNSGWFNKKGFGPGTRVTNLPPIPMG